MNAPELMDPLIRLALAAGEAILAVYDDPATVAEWKADGSPVTEADRLAEAIIADGLAPLADTIPMLAEEAVAAGRIPPVRDRAFLVDPLDGTREFLARNGEFTVNIALVESGAPVAGVVYAPALGEIFCGGRNAGAFAARVEGEGLSEWRPLSGRTPPLEGLHALISRSHLTRATEVWLDQRSIARRTPVGSSLKFCRLAEGLADVNPRFGATSAWDTAAGQAILEAAGGAVLTLDGEPLRYALSGPTPRLTNPAYVAWSGAPTPPP